jgi:hypothetical protein
VIGTAMDFIFRLGCTLIGLAVVHAILVAASVSTIASYPNLLAGTIIGFCCGWLSKSDG